MGQHLNYEVMVFFALYPKHSQLQPRVEDNVGEEEVLPLPGV